MTHRSAGLPQDQASPGRQRFPAPLGWGLQAEEHIRTKREQINKPPASRRLLTHGVGRTVFLDWTPGDLFCFPPATFLSRLQARSRRNWETSGRTTEVLQRYYECFFFLACSMDDSRQRSWHPLTCVGGIYPLIYTNVLPDS